MIRRGALAFAAVALVAAYQPGAHEGRGRPAVRGPVAPGSGTPKTAAPSGPPQDAGLGPLTAFVTAVRSRRPVPLDPRTVAAALATVQRILDRVDTLAPQRGGPRLLANLRLNEYLLDVAIWKPQALIVGGRRLSDISGIVIPFTGAWRHRVLVVREGEVEASPALLDSPDLSALERTVESSGGHP